MKVFQLNLFKKSSNHNSLDSKDCLNYFTVFGHFDYMQVEQIEDAQKLFEYNASKIIDGDYFNKYTMLLFDLDNERENPLLNQQEKETNLFLITCMKLNISDVNIHPDNQIQSKEILIRTANLIKERIKPVLQEVEAECYFYGCLGSFDMICIIAGKRVKKLFSILPYIKDASVNDSLLLQNTNSFLAVHSDFNTMKEQDQPVEILIRYSLKKAKDNEMLFGFFNDYMQYDTPEDAPGSAHSMSSYYTYGEHDYTIEMKNCSLYKLIYLLKHNKQPSPIHHDLIEEKAMDYYNNCIKNAINFTYSRIQFERILFDKKSNLEAPCHRDSFNNHKFMSLNRLYEKTLALFPVPALRTLELLMDKCEIALSKNAYSISGERIFTILKTLFESMIQFNENIESNVIMEYIGNTRSLLDIIMQSDNVHLDHIDIDELESMYPIIKFISSYENIFRKTAEYINRTDTEYLFFLTMYPKDRFKSVQYFTNGELSENEKKKIISINLPNAHFFKPELAMPYLVHEVGHYVTIMDDKNKSKNKAFYYTFICKIKLDLWEYICNYSVTLKKLNMDEYTELFNEFIIPHFQYKGTIDFEIPFNQFYMNMKRLIHKIYEEITSNCIDKINDMDSFSNAEGYICLHMILNKYIHNPNEIEYIYLLIKESRADIIMCQVCNLNVQKYLYAQYKYLVDNKELTAIGRTSYKLRLAVVLLTLCEFEQIDGNQVGIELRKSVELLQNKKIAHFFVPVIDLAYEQYEFLLGIFTYLKNTFLKLAETDLPLNGNDIYFYKDFENMKIDQIVDFMMDEWYFNLTHWNRKGQQERRECNGN